jgi:hypothetical protein
MDHAEALEQIEIAAAEPGGIDRLMAGDTAEAALVAGHLAGCPPCMRHLASIRRTAQVAAAVVREQPDPALRERTLAYVRAMGRPAAPGPLPLSGGGGDPHAGLAPGLTPGFSPGPVPAGPAGAGPVVLGSTRRGPGALPWAASLVATAAVAVSVTFAAVGMERDRQLASQAEDLSVLSRTTALAMKVDAQPDATRVVLRSSDGSAEGTVMYAARSGDLVIIATGLQAPPEGSEWVAWMDHGGVRRPIGRMQHNSEIAAWAGPVDGLGSVGRTARFGVSLAAASSWLSGDVSPGAEPVLLGEP